MTKCSALEYAAKGIRINAVCHGKFETSMVDRMISAGDLDIDWCIKTEPIGRLGQLEELAAVLWLCSPASYVIGHGLIVDGGYTIQ